MKQFKQIGMEMSLKPFIDNSESYIEEKLHEIFTQWATILKHTQEIAVLLWIGDGSELLDYKGNFEEEIEWGRYIGSANPRTRKDMDQSEYWDPEEIHNKHQIYRENPPIFTYGDIKKITQLIKRVGKEVTGKTILVGETFDPGPEFAVSTFKYDKHKEICLSTMEDFPFVGCYATLNADDTAYAGFPNGIPESTPFGVFFGRQAQHFLSDLGFDYIWFSNGFGFGIEPWNTSGAVFDGLDFDDSKVDMVADKCLSFWRFFRDECGYPIKTRGTNMATGIDISSDAVPLDKIYSQVTDIEPPPNSPWVSLDGDFGLELAGWMSHIAKLPAEDYPFRFYIHDPWWDNSPWLDRYERMPHDIHMPMAVSRIDNEGKMHAPTILEFLSIDNSFGETPDQVPNEVIPEILFARDHLPDAPGPLVWVYPFDLYHDMMHKGNTSLRKIFLGDWYIRGAVNRGLPLNTVVDQEVFSSLMKTGKTKLFSESVLLIPLLSYGDDFYRELLSLVEGGAKVILYGAIDICPLYLLQAMGLEKATELAGDFSLQVAMPEDMYSDSMKHLKLNHPKSYSDGGIAAVAKTGTNVVVRAIQEEGERAYATHTPIGKGSLAWIRASNSFEEPIITRLPIEKDTTEYIRPAVLLRYLLSQSGFSFFFAGQKIEDDEPVQVVSRNKGSFWYSGFVPDSTTTLHYAMPWGAPLFTSHDAIIQDDMGSYRFERAFTKECRIFIKGQKTQNSVQTSELATINPKYTRRILIRGLNGATITFFPEPGYENRTDFVVDHEHTHYRRAFVIPPENYLDPELVQTNSGSLFRVKDFSGNLLISW